MASSGLKLYYFDGRGRGELARLVLAAGQKKYEDIRFNMDEWIATYKALAPFGQAPFLEVEGKRYAQSFAIANFLARDLNLFGKDNMDALAIEQVQGLVKDIADLYGAARFAIKEEFPDEKLMEKLNKEHYPRFLAFFEKLLKENGTGYFVGSSLTMADLNVYDVTEEPVLHIPDVVKGFPLVMKNRKLVSSTPAIAAYLESRPTSPW